MAMDTNISGGVSGAKAGVGLESSSPLHTNFKPVAYGVLGHYWHSIRVSSTAAQAANSRIYEFRNGGSNLFILTRCTLRALQATAGTAQENSIDVFKCTGFTAVDTVNTITPALSVARTGTMAAAPGGAVIRALNPAAAGMTGGTLTKDGSPFASLAYAVSATAGGIYQTEGVVDIQGTHPPTFAANEGFEIENRVLNVTSFGVTWILDIALAEVTAY